VNKVDVSVQSYNKPESLIYSLLTLHKHCKDKIDTVWINDDQSDSLVMDKYHRLRDSNVLHPWKIETRVNKKRMGWWVSFSYKRIPKYVTLPFLLKRIAWNFYKNKTVFVEPQDFRYQWAIESTNKSKLLVIHDDVEFLGDVVSLLNSSLNNLDNPGIVGELGQCWRCRYKKTGCTPSKILDGVKPSEEWPMTRKVKSDHKWACRINEWVAMINVDVTREIAMDDNVFFGNYDDDGDIGAYWFSRLVDKGFSFDDPFASSNKDISYFKHWDGGITGHSAWVDQGNGQNKYNPEELSSRIFREFNYEV